MAIITGFKSGKSYTFKNLTTEKMLNLYGGRTDKGTNVCQYTQEQGSQYNACGRRCILRVPSKQEHQSSKNKQCVSHYIL